MEQEQKNNKKQENRGIGIWFLSSMVLSFVTVALVVNGLIKSENWIEEAIIGAILSIGGVWVGIIFELGKGGSFMRDVGSFLLAFIVLMDIGLFYCWISQGLFEMYIDTKICTLSIAISYVIGYGIGELCAADIEKKEKDNQKE